jgi:hypothetical protein
LCLRHGGEAESRCGGREEFISFHIFIRI